MIDANRVGLDRYCDNAWLSRFKEGDDADF